MMRFVRDLRLVSITVIAVACLLLLKTADLVLDRASAPSQGAAPTDEPTVIRTAPGLPRPGDAHRSWAQQMFNFPVGGETSSPQTDLAQLPAINPYTASAAADKANADIITGSVPDKSDENKDAKPETNRGQAGTANKKVAAPNGRVIAIDGPPAPSTAERAILGRLQERRQELDKRTRELDIREGLIAEAEKRIEARLAEIKEGEAQLATATEKKNEAEAARFKGLVTMYENMKPRDAAKIFDRLEIDVLMEVASQINPRRMSDIMAQMSPDVAEKLTTEMASRAKSTAKRGAELPKIEGHPTAR